jgi:glucokinase
MEKLIVGIDIGGTRTKIGLVDLLTGKVVRSIIEPTEKESAERFEHRIKSAIQELITTSNAEQKRVEGIGFGVPSFVWTDGTVDSTYGFVRFMEDYPLVKIIESAFGIPCRVDNDARTVALGEALFGEGKGYARMLMLTLGTGLGMGFTHQGKLPELLPYSHMGGHMRITTNDVVCYCGKTGCLESLVSATGLLAAARRAGMDSNNDVSFSTERILESVIQGQPVAQAVVKQYLALISSYSAVGLQKG